MEWDGRVGLGWGGMCWVGEGLDWIGLDGVGRGGVDRMGSNKSNLEGMVCSGMGPGMDGSKRKDT